MTQFRVSGQRIRTECKACESARRKRRYELRLKADPEAIKRGWNRAAKRYKARHPERRREISRRHYRKLVSTDEGRAKVNSRAAPGRRNKTPWCTWPEIWAIYREAKRLTKETGRKHVVDHYVPVTHPLVAGLHTPANLRVIPEDENLSKSNKIPAELAHLFWDLPEHLTYPG